MPSKRTGLSSSATWMRPAMGEVTKNPGRVCFGRLLMVHAQGAHWALVTIAAQGISRPSSSPVSPLLNATLTTMSKLPLLASLNDRAFPKRHLMKGPVVFSSEKTAFGHT
jgi:hypothetical protein